MEFWAYARGVKLEFSRPRKPIDNTLIESFNRSLRCECLNTQWFEDADDARAAIQAWRSD